MSASPLKQSALWTRARASFARAVGAIGAPAAIAALTLTPKLRRTIAGWLLRLEHVVRRLLLVEATELKRITPSPRGEGAGGGVNLQLLRSRAALACANSSASSITPPPNPLSSRRGGTPRFSFAIARDPRAVPKAHAPRIRALFSDGATPQPQTHHTPTEQGSSAQRLARRFEALRAVLDDPIPHARRLARVLTRAVRRFPEIVHRFALALSRTNAFDRDDHRLSIDAMSCALDAAYAFENSS